VPHGHRGGRFIAYRRYRLINQRGPWQSFITALDSKLDEPADSHCIGDFAVRQNYGFGRETADPDVLSLIEKQSADGIIQLAGKGSSVHNAHRVYLELVAVANHPEDYEVRLLRAFPIWLKVRPWVLERHDLALTKFDCCNERDIRDVIFCRKRA
jgi:hypothetical protein